MFVTYGVYTWVAPYLDESAGFSTGEISLALSVMTLAGIPGTLGAGWLAYRTRRPLAVSIAGFTITLLLLVLALRASPSLAVAAFVSAVCAFGVSLGMSPLYGLPPTMFGPTAAGTATGVTTSVAMTGAVTSTYAGGWIVGAAGYDVAFFVYTAAAAAAAAVIVPALAAQHAAFAPGGGCSRANCACERRRSLIPAPGIIGTERAFSSMKEVEMVFATVLGAAALAGIGSLWAKSGRDLVAAVRDSAEEA